MIVEKIWENDPVFGAFSLFPKLCMCVAGEEELDHLDCKCPFHMLKLIDFSGSKLLLVETGFQLKLCIIVM